MNAHPGILLILVIIVTSLTSCTARQHYVGLQTREKNLCAEQAANQYQECIERQDMSYDDYQDLRGRDSDGG